MGRKMGFEPTHIGTTIRGLNRLTTSAISYKTILTKTDLKSSSIFIFLLCKDKDHVQHNSLSFVLRH